MGAVKHRTLAADTVATVSLDGNYATVKVTNLDGAAEVWFTTDGTTAPVVGKDGAYVLPAAICSDDFPDETPGFVSTVKMIASAPVRVSVRGV